MQPIELGVSNQARHARACPGHPRLAALKSRKTWMAGTGPAKTKKAIHFQAIGKSLKMLDAFSVRL
jgi:hypothetical protein